MSLANIADGLRIYLPFQEGAGQTRVDAWGYSDVIDPGGVVGQDTGKVNTFSATFDIGGAEFLIQERNRVNSAFNWGDDDFSMAFWYNQQSDADGGVVAQLQLLGDQSAFQLQYLAAGNLLRWIVYPPGGGSTLAVISAITLNVWYFVHVYHDKTANVIGISLNNAAPTTSAHSTGVFQSEAPLMFGAYIGASGNTDFPGDCLLEQFTLHDRVLSSAELTSMYNSFSGVNLATTLDAEAIPAAPSQLNISSENSTTALLTWSDNSDNEGHFDLQRATSYDGPWTTIQNAPSNSVNANVSQLDTGLSTETTYFWRVRAVNPTGSSAWSNVASGQTTDVLAKLLPDLVVYQALHEVSGTRFDGYERTAVNFTDINTVGSGEGPTGICANFNQAASEYLSAEKVTDLNLSGSFAYAFWFRLDLNTQMGIVTKLNNRATGKAFTFQYFSGGTRLRFIVSHDGTTSTTNLSMNNFGAPTIGRWYFVVITHDADADTISGEIDNSSLDSAAHSTGIFATTDAPFRIGGEGDSDGNPNDLMDGRIVGLVGVNRIFTTDEKTALYNEGVGVNLDGVILGKPIPKTTYFAKFGDQEARGSSYGYTNESLPEGRSIMAVYNEKGSGLIVRVKHAYVAQQFGQSSNTSNRNAAQVERITAASGGIDISDQIVPMDTNTSALPSQVVFRHEPTSITNDDNLHHIHTIPQWTAFRDSAQMTTHSAGARANNLDMGTVLRHGYSNQGDPTQKIILREGEGVAMDQTGQKTSATMHVWITFTDGTDTYIASTYFTPWYSNNWFSLVNESGSGVILEVLTIEIHEEGDTSEPVYDLRLIDQVRNDEPGNQEFIVPFSHDTANTLPDSVQVTKHRVVRQVGTNKYTDDVAEVGENANWTTKRKMQMGRGKYRFGDDHTFGSMIYASEVFSASTGVGEFILREGFGCALLQSRVGMGGRKEMGITFTVEPATTTDRPHSIIGGHHIIRSNYGR